MLNILLKFYLKRSNNTQEDQLLHIVLYEPNACKSILIFEILKRMINVIGQSQEC